MSSDAARKELHSLVDALPESDIATAKRLLEALAATNDELSEEEDAAIHAGLRSLASGQQVSRTVTFERWRKITP
jgi:hypothetical protein